MKILDFEGLKSLIAEIKRRLSLKQDAEPGKQLSEENYTSADKEKLDGIDLSEYVKFTDFASTDNAGVVLISGSRGVGTETDTHFLRINKATETQLEQETNNFNPLVSSSIPIFMSYYGISSKTTIPEMQEQIDSLVGPKSFELIEEITINEEDILEIKRTEEPDGTAYDFEKVFFKVNLSEANAQTIRAYTNWNVTNNVVYMSFSETAMYSAAILEIKNGLGFAMTINPRSNINTTGNVSIYGAGFGTPAANISSLRFSSSASYPVNSTIEIYAVRRKNYDSKN